MPKEMMRHNWLTLMVPCLVLLVSIPAPAASILIFRLDDYRAAIPSDVDRLSIDIRILDLFSRYEIPLTLAVIPLAQTGQGGSDVSAYRPITKDRERIRLITETFKAADIEIALHGLRHERNNVGRSEWRKRPYLDQLADLTIGKQMLEESFGRPVTTFVPPWNSLEWNTIIALEQLSFTCLSSSPSLIPGNPFGRLNTSLTLLPATTSLPTVKAAIKNARTKGYPCCIVVYFNGFVFCEVSGSDRLSEQKFEELTSLLEYVKSCRGLDILTLQSASRRFQNELEADFQRFNANAEHRILGLIAARNPFSELHNDPLARTYPRVPTGVYWDRATARRKATWLAGQIILVLALPCCLGGIALAWLGRRYLRRIWLVAIGALLAVFVVGFVLQPDYMVQLFSSPQCSLLRWISLALLMVFGVAMLLANLILRHIRPTAPAPSSSCKICEPSEERNGNSTECHRRQ